MSSPRSSTCRTLMIAAACGSTFAVAAPGCQSAPRADSTSVATAAEFVREQLRDSTLPFWLEQTTRSGLPGFVAGYDAWAGPQDAHHRHIISQSRLVWTFARAHRAGFRDRDYLGAARRGFRSLERDFRDRAHGGYHYTVDFRGEPTETTKYLYTQSFVIYAYSEFAAASGDDAPREAAMDLFRLVQTHLHDNNFPGWFEVAERDWRIATPDPEPTVGVAEPDYKSANSHLHWMEALTELYRLTGDTSVRVALAESLNLNERYFFPRDPDRCVYYVRTDLMPSMRPDHEGLSYGHNVEAAWLMAEGRRALGMPIDWTHYNALVDHALEHALVEAERGALLLTEGHANTGPLRDIAVWWSQAELIAALSYALMAGQRTGDQDLLERVIAWHLGPQMHQPTGVPYSEVSAAGKPTDARLAWDWKAAYHDIRGRLMYLDYIDSVATFFDRHRMHLYSMEAH